MNILFLTTHLNTGGITSYLLTLCRGLLERNHQIWIVSSGGDREDDFRTMGCNVLTLDIRTKSDLSPKIFKNIPVLEKLVLEQKIDIIHAQTRVTQVLARLLQRRTNSIYIATCHGYFKRRLNRRIAPCWGDMTIAISEAVYTHLLDDFEVLGDRVVKIENGIDINQFVPPSDEQRKTSRHNLNLNSQLAVGIIARLSDVKGIDVLIRAMPRVIEVIPEVVLLIFGQGKEECALKELVDQLNLNKTIQFLSTVNDTPRSLAALDVFVMPSRQEGLGLSVMEAQACGCAVIASRVGGLPSLIDNEKTGILVDSEKPDQLADAIINVLSDTDFATELGRRAREFIVKECSSEIMVNKTANLYSRLMT